MTTFTINVNDRDYRFEALPDMPLLWALRDLMNLTGTKFGCGKGLCGACTILLNGTAVRACSVPVSAVKNAKITTIEGLAKDSRLTALQNAWIEEDVAQCGYCQAGQLMTATALLRKNAKPTDAEIEEAMSGNICRCGTYLRIKKAIRKAAKGGVK